MNSRAVQAALQSAEAAKEKAFNGNPFYRAGTPSNAVNPGEFAGGINNTEFGQAAKDPQNFAYFFGYGETPEKNGYVNRLAIFNNRQASGNPPPIA